MPTYTQASIQPSYPGSSPAKKNGERAWKNWSRAPWRTVYGFILIIKLLPTQSVLSISALTRPLLQFWISLRLQIGTERLFHYCLTGLKHPVWCFKYSFYHSAKLIWCHDIVSSKRHRRQLPYWHWQHWLLLTMSARSLWKAFVNRWILLAVLVSSSQHCECH